jgi:hypothetical protein
MLASALKIKQIKFAKFTTLHNNKSTKFKEIKKSFRRKPPLKKYNLI